MKTYITISMKTDFVQFLKSLWPASRLRRCFVLSFVAFLPLVMVFNVLLENRSFYNELVFKGLDFQKGYLIDTPGCKILNYEPSPPAMNKYFRLYNKISCDKGSRYNITSSEMNILYFYPENIYKRYLGLIRKPVYLKAKEIYLRKRNAEGVKEFLSHGHVHCYYRSIERVAQSRDNYTKSADNLFKYGYYYEIVDFKTTISKYDAVIVECKYRKKTIYSNVHHMVQRKIPFKKPSSQNHEKQLNVIIFGTDSLSRLAFLRDNPKTYNYLIKDLKAYEFIGVNKVGENTLPNVAVILSGMTLTEMLQVCFTEIDKKIDDDHQRPSDGCPLIWKDFKRKGYVTALIEDWPNAATFNYRRLGFVIQPTDHYARPGFLVARKTGVAWDNEICHGSKLSYDILHEYSRDLLRTYKNESVFGYFWGSSLTHDVLNLGVFTDKPHVNYLKSLKDNGLLNHTILFFLSDHGIRFGKFRETYMGKFEENLPYLFIVVPEWFKKSYPEAAKNLEENRAKLLTPFDVHETLRDILNQNYKNSSYVLETPSNQRRNISLFQKLPSNRTCADIGIPLKFCACQEYTPMKNTDQIYEKLSKYLKQYINKILEKYPECSKIENVTVYKALRGFGAKSFFGNTIGEIVSVQAEYVPGNALIEATVIWDKNEQESPFQVAGGISRINKYGNQSHCVTDAEVIKLCVCKDIL